MMNPNKKATIIKQIQAGVVEHGMDMNQLIMIMSDKGFKDPTVQEFIQKSGMTISQNEFLEIYDDLKGMIEKTRKDASAKVQKEKEEKEKVEAPSFQDIVENKQIKTNDEDLLTKIKKGSGLPDENYSDESEGVSYTVGSISDEPPAEEVTLPSKGRFYRGIIADKKGKLLVRPMTLKEEKIFSTERLLKTGQAIDMVFRNCIKTPGIDTTQLLSADRIFLLFYLRGVSYGSKYPVTLRCSNCGNEIEYEIDIANLDITEPPKELEEPFNIVLPMSGLKLTLALSRGKNESKMVKETYAPKKAKEMNNSLVNRLLDLTIDIEGVEKKNWNSKLENLVGKDISHIRRTMELVNFGYKLDEWVICDNCSAHIKVELDVNENFFRAG